MPYGDAAALAAAIDDDTVAVLLEPIQGEGGVIIPPDGYLAEVRRLCTAHNVLMIADEIQSGLGRTGETFACDHEGVVPDVYILGKALGGGIMPVSAVVARADVMRVFTPGRPRLHVRRQPARLRGGDRGRPDAADRRVPGAGPELGEFMRDLLAALPGGPVSAVRSRGLWAGVDIVGRTAATSARG